ncbi:MAG: hypothetical protein LBK68_02860 [Candidatus Margulisbacteria bacterium]|nr:hypothetical protein [Candidatus Margulisiibacteriota bacterium]
MTRILHTEIKSGERLVATDITDLTFFPKGAILTFSSAAWSATSQNFQTIWKVCNKANHDADPNNVPDLTNRFLRGGSSSDFTTGGGADSRSISIAAANLPAHSHGVTKLPVSELSASGLSVASGGGGHSHTVSGNAAAGSGAHTHTGSGTTNSGSGGHKHSDISGATSNTSKTLTGTFGLIDDGRGNEKVSGVFTHAAWSGKSWDGDGGNRTIITMDVTHTHDITGSTGDNSGTHSHDVNVTIPEGGSHSHTISGSTSEGGGTHSHTLSGSISGGSVSGTTDSSGSGTPFSVATLPAYYTVIYIIKVV